MTDYSAVAVERTMKIQEVILWAIGKKSRRGRQRRSLGSATGRCGGGRIAMRPKGMTGCTTGGEVSRARARFRWKTARSLLELYRDKYAGFNVRHFHEKLREVHGIALSHMWVKLVLQGAGLVKKGRKRGVHRKRREHRPLPGMMLNLDGIFRTTVGMTSSRCSMTRPARPATRNWWKRNRRAPSWRRCAR